MLLELIIFLYVVYFSYTVLKYAITVIFYLYVCWLFLLLFWLLLMLLLLHQLIITTTTHLLPFVIIPFHLMQLLINIIQYKRIIKTHNWLNPLILHLFLFYLWLYQSISMHFIPSLTTRLLCVCFCWFVVKCIF